MNIKRLLKITVPFIVVFAGFFSLEAVLRMVDYGHNSSFITYRPSSTGPRAVLNPGALLAYTGLDVVSSSKESYVNVAVDKPDDNLRVLVLGGSAAYGAYHLPDLGPARYLEAMLGIGFPEYTVEVVNLAFPSLHSGAMVRVLKEAMSLQPDMVVYYGAVNDLGRSVVMQKSPLPPRAVYFLEEAVYFVKRLKTYQLAVDRGGRYLGRVLAFFIRDRYDDFQSFQTLRPEVSSAMTAAYRSNIRKIISICKKNNIPVFLCTFAHNTKNPCSADPFNGGINLQDIEEHLPLLRRAYTLELAGEYRDAIEYYEKLHQALPGLAGPLSRLAGCYQALDMPRRATMARERTQTLSVGYTPALAMMNRVLREISLSSQADVFLVDVADGLNRDRPTGFMPDGTFFTDAVHFTAEGSYAAAAEIYKVLAGHIAAAFGGDDPDDPPPSQQECEIRMGVTPPLKQSLMAADQRRTFVSMTALMGRPPLSQSLMHDVVKEQRLQIFSEKTGEVDYRDDVITILSRPMPDSPDYYLHKNQVALLLTDEHPEAAADVARQLVEKSGRHSLALILYGRVLLRQNQPEQTLKIFQEALEQKTRAHDLGLRLSTAELALFLNRPEEAIEMLEAGWRLMENRSPVTGFGKSVFAGFRQRYLSVLADAQRRLSPPGSQPRG